MRIIIADSMEESVVQGIRELGEVEYKPADLVKAIAEAEVLVVRSATKVTRELLSHAGRLRLVVRGGVGTDNIDKEACKEKGVEVRNTPGASSNAVAELALGLMICGLRNVQKAHHQMKEGRWEKKALTGAEVQGKTLGIIGHGRIGSMLAGKAKALGMEVIAYSPPPRKEQEGVRFIDDLQEFLGRADVISLHVPSLPQTINMIDRERIAMMKDGAFLVNTARGDIVDEDALYEACRGGKLSGAALDVFRSEPYKGKLADLENVYLSPHIAASTKEAQERIGKEIIETIRDLSG